MTAAVLVIYNVNWCLLYYAVKKKIFLLVLVLFLLHLMNYCDIESLAYVAYVLQQLLQTPLALSFNRNLLWGNEDTFSASSNYFVHTVHCCVRADSVAVVVS